MRKNLLIGALCLLLPIALSSCATSVGYLWKQGTYLIKYSSGAKNISSMLRNGKTPSDLKGFLRSVERIKQFAVDHIGLANNKNYTRYKAIDRDYLVNVVQAAKPLSFTAYKWKYPLFGKLPYKGYYVPADAKAEAERLEKEGYDVIVRKVDAFSTLGFFRDPVYSFMRGYTPYELASLIIHEQTHATLFLKGQDQFNEEMATYVGDRGALEYLASVYGKGSSEYAQALAEQQDNRLFLKFIMQLRDALSAVYASDLPKAEKLAKKKATIARSMKILDTEYVPRFQTESYRSLKKLPINNAYLMLFGLYTQQIPLLERYDNKFCGNNLKAFMESMERLAKEPGTMIEKIKSRLASGQ